MRKRKITVTKYTGHPKYRFVLNFREDGKRKREFYETRAPAMAEAARKKAELEKFGIEGAEFSSRLRVEAQECAERLMPFGKTLTNATDFFVGHLKASERSCTAKELVDLLVATKENTNKSARHLSDLRSRLGIFAEKFDGRIVATISGEEIGDWLNSLEVSATTKNHYRRLVILLFNFAVKRRFATDNPAVATEKSKEDDSPPGILTVTQTARLLESAAPELVPFIAIGAFAGLRRAELERLDWKDIHFDDGLVEVTAVKSKTARRRFIRIQPNLREWLLPVRKHTGKVTCEDFRKAFDRARRDAGITDWPDNALRHSFASYHFAHFKDAAALALEMGHTDSGVIFSNYRQLVRPADAARYWSIAPQSHRKVVQMHA
jgi:integrase